MFQMGQNQMKKWVNPTRKSTAVQRDGTRPPTEAMIAFIEDQRIVYGVESICRVLPIAPSTYYHRLACLADPSRTSARLSDVKIWPPTSGNATGPVRSSLNSWAD